MHPFGENGQTGVPAFLAKLWRLVEDPETNNLISWSSDGRSFIIQNQAKFAKDLLPLNYKHNNMASFIRQLNMYGFHKITSIDNGGLKFDKDEMEFSHPYFQKGHPYLLEHIKRKIANPKQNEEKGTSKIEAMNRVLTEVKTMRGRQDSLDSRFSAMKQENEALWREVAILRQKHMKQQQIVNKLIQFLVTFVQPNRSGLSGMGGKRRCQLMINDAPQSKVRCIQDLLENYYNTVKKNEERLVIHDLSEELLDEAIDPSDSDDIEIPNVESPGSMGSHSPVHASGGGGADENSFGSTSSNAVNYDDIDEIDTNNMAIYDDNENNIEEELAPLIKKELIKQENLSNQSSIIFDQQMMGQQKPNNQQQNNDVKFLQNKLKKEPSDNANCVTVSGPKRASKKQTNVSADSKSKSLLLPSKSNQLQGNNKKPAETRKNDSGASSRQNENDILFDLLENNRSANPPPPPPPLMNVVGVSQQPSSSGKSLNNGKSMMYGKDDYLVPNEIPQVIFDENSQNSQYVINDDIHLFDGTYNNNDFSNNNADDKDHESKSVTKYNPSTSNDIMRLQTPNDYSSHLDKVQYDLDSLKDLLRSETYHVDNDTLLGQQTGDSTGRLYIPQHVFDVDTINKLFGQEDVLPFEISPETSEMFASAIDKKSPTPSKETVMSLLEYQPPQFLQQTPTLSTPTNDLNELEMLEMLTQ